MYELAILTYTVYLPHLCLRTTVMHSTRNNARVTISDDLGHT